MSLREEINQSFHRSSNGATTSLEELFMPCSNEGDQFLALVSAANNFRTANLNSEFKTGPKTSVNKWDLMTDVEEQGDEEKKQEKAVGSGDLAIIIKRSKSCHSFALGRFDGLPEEDENNLSNKNRVHSRSFHTVEEYDALLERILAEKTGFDGGGDYDDNGLVYKESSLKKSHNDEDDNFDDTHEENSVEQKSMIKEVNPSPSSSSSTNEELKVVKNVAQKNNSSATGLRRKALAKELDSLKIPPTIEFPRISSLTERFHEGGQAHYSSEAYVTPKFGSYALPISEAGNESSIFNPDLVAAFEVCMRKLEEEEEGIIKQITNNEEADGADEMQN